MSRPMTAGLALLALLLAGCSQYIAPTEPTAMIRKVEGGYAYYGPVKAKAALDGFEFDGRDTEDSPLEAAGKVLGKAAEAVAPLATVKALD